MKRYTAISGIEMGICVMTFLSAIVGMVFIFNPDRKYAMSRNEIRTKSVNSISNAVSLYLNDNGSSSLSSIPVSSDCKASTNEICKTSSASCEGYVDLSDMTDTNKYLAVIPVDPSSRSQLGTGYNIVKNDSGVVTVCAPLAEQKVDISLSK